MQAAEHQQGAAAFGNKIANHDQLIGREAGGFDAADNEGVVGEEFAAFGGETVGELFCGLDALAVELVRTDAQQRFQPKVAVVRQGTPHELVFPARLTFEVQHAVAVIDDVHQARPAVVAILEFALDAVDGELELMGACGAQLEIHRHAR